MVKDIVITGTQGKPMGLDIFYNKDEINKPVVIYAHGFNGFKDWGNCDLVAKIFAEQGFTFVKFNFSHNGTTPDNPTAFTDLDAFAENNYSKELNDFSLVVDWVCDAKNPHRAFIDEDNIYLIGHSLGGGIATLLAAEDTRIKKLVTWAAVAECKTPWGNWPLHRIEMWQGVGVQYYTNTRTNQQMPLNYQLYEDYENNKERLDIKKAIGSLTIPVLICHGSLDLSVPIDAAYELKDANPSAALLELETNHVFDRQHPWIMTYLPEAMELLVGKTIAFLK